MEKRLGTRMHIGTDAIIDCRPAGLCRCIIHNCSISGLYVELSEQPLSVNSRADIVFFLNVNGVTHLRRVRTHVIRRDAGGYGLMLNEITADAVALQNQLCETIPELVAPRKHPDSRLPILRSHQ